MKYILYFLTLNLALVSCKSSHCSIDKYSLEEVFDCCNKEQDLSVSLSPFDTIFETFPEELFSCYPNPEYLSLELQSLKAPTELYKVNKAKRISLKFGLKENKKEFNQDTLVQQLQTFRDAEWLFLGDFFMLKELFEDVLKFPNLEELFLSNYNALESSIQEFPENLDKLPKLKILTLSDLNVKSLDLNERNFQHLIKLEIGNVDKGQELNFDNFKAPVLKHLLLRDIKVKYNELAQILEDNSKILRELVIEYVELGTFPENLSNCKNLQVLRLAELDLDGLPKGILNLKKLKRLSYINMLLNELPKNFEELKKLEEVVFIKNQLQEFPLKLTELKKLQYLDLSNNPITTIPKEIANLKKLKILNLYGVQLSESNKLELKKWLPNTKIQF